MLSALAVMLLCGGFVTRSVSAETTAGSPATHEKQPARWWRGNLHTHTLWSDGDSYPEQIVEWYKANGYHFLVLSDHNILSRDQKWINPVKNKYARGQGAANFRRYQEQYGPDWVVTRRVDQSFHDWLYSQPGGREHRPEEDEISVGDEVVRLKTLNEYRTRFEEPDRFLLVQGEEITDRPRTIHLNAINLVDPIEPQGATVESAADTILYNVRAVAAQSARFGQPMLTTLNHPNFMWAVTAEDMASVSSLHFVEINNGGSEEDRIRRDGQPSGAEWGNAVRPGVERMWDIALTLRLARGDQSLLYGLATDDAHEHAFAPGIGRSSPGRGWVVVRAVHLSPASLVTAMEAGDFYTSTGVALDDLSFDGKTLRIEIADRPGATFRTKFIGTRKDYNPASEKLKDGTGAVIATRYSPEVGMVLAEAPGLHPRYTLQGDELYVRAVITSSETAARPRRAGELQQAWVQPVMPSKAEPGETTGPANPARRGAP